MPFYRVDCNLCEISPTHHQSESSEAASASHANIRQHKEAEERFGALIKSFEKPRSNEFTHGKDHHA